MINRDAVYMPQPNELLSVRGLVDNRTVMWSFNVTEGQWMPAPDLSMRLTGRIVGAEFFSGIDERLKNQRDSIDRMLKHLQYHCPMLAGTGGCAHQERTQEGPSA